jgi:hypothetical protein
MEILVALIVGFALGSFVFASLYDRRVVGQKEIIVSVIFRVDDAKLCGNCSAVYDATEHRCCPKCTSTMGMFVINNIKSDDPKVGLVKQHLKDMREGKFRTTPKPDKVIQLDTVREEKVSASDLS